MVIRRSLGSRACEHTQSTLQWCLWPKLVMTEVPECSLWGLHILPPAGPHSICKAPLGFLAIDPPPRLTQLCWQVPNPVYG